MKNSTQIFSPMKEDRSDCGFVLADYVEVNNSISFKPIINKRNGSRTI